VPPSNDHSRGIEKSSEKFSERTGEALAISHH
jgi:hypothetical protein